MAKVMFSIVFVGLSMGGSVQAPPHFNEGLKPLLLQDITPPHLPRHVPTCSVYSRALSKWVVGIRLKYLLVQ